MGPRVDIFFNHKMPESGELKDNQRLIATGDQFYGTYVGSFVSGQYDSRIHKITVTKGELTGKTIGLPSTTTLDRFFQKVPDGTRTQVTYKGRATKDEMPDDWKGQLPYRYDAQVPKPVRLAIEAGKLPARYEVKERDKK